MPLNDYFNGTKHVFLETCIWGFGKSEHNVLSINCTAGNFRVFCSVCIFLQCASFMLLCTVCILAFHMFFATLHAIESLKYFCANLCYINGLLNTTLVFSFILDYCKWPYSLNLGNQGLCSYLFVENFPKIRLMDSVAVAETENDRWA